MNPSKLTAIVITAIVTMLTACSTTRVSSSKAGDIEIPIETVSRNEIQVFEVRAAPSGTGTKVLGKLQKNAGFETKPGTHVHITVTDKSGKTLSREALIIDTSKWNPSYYTRFQPVSFEKRLLYPPSQIGKIRAEFHGHSTDQCNVRTTSQTSHEPVADWSS